MNKIANTSRVNTVSLAVLALSVLGISLILLFKDFSPTVICDCCCEEEEQTPIAYTLVQRDTVSAAGTTGTIVRIEETDPCAEGQDALAEVIIWNDCPETQETTAQKTSEKVIERAEPVVEETVKTLDEEQTETTTVHKEEAEEVESDAIPEPEEEILLPIEGKVSMTATAEKQGTNINLLNYSASAYYLPRIGLSLDTARYLFSHLDADGNPASLLLTSVLDGDHIAFNVALTSDGGTENLFLKEQRIPLNLNSMPEQQLSYLYEYWEQTIDQALRRKGKAQIWTGVGLVGGSIVSHLFLHRQTTPVLQTENGMDYFDRNNPFYDENVLARRDRRIQYGWEGLNYAAAATGGYLIWRGHKNLKSSVSLAPGYATFTWNLTR